MLQLLLHDKWNLTSQFVLYLDVSVVFVFCLKQVHVNKQV